MHNILLKYTKAKRKTKQDKRVKLLYSPRHEVRQYLRHILQHVDEVMS